MSTPTDTINTIATTDSATTTDTTTAPSCEGVAEGVRHLLEEATASGRIGCATEEEAAETLRRDLEQLERDHGLNVVPFPEAATRRTTDTTSAEGGEA